MLVPCNARSNLETPDVPRLGGTVGMSGVDTLCTLPESVTSSTMASTDAKKKYGM